MKRTLFSAAVGMLAMLAACEPANDITLTNSNNVVLNDHQANYASRNEGEAPLNAMGPERNQPSNGIELPANATQ